jgi:hypothetical protein
MVIKSEEKTSDSISDQKNFQLFISLVLWQHCAKNARELQKQSELSRTTKIHHRILAVLSRHDSC